MTGSGRGMKGVPIAISSFFPSPSGYKKSPGKFLGNDIAMVIVVEGGGGAQGFYLWNIKNASELTF